MDKITSEDVATVQRLLCWLDPDVSNHIRGLINHYEKTKDSQWVSVDDRMPELRVSVLITDGENIGHARIVNSCNPHFEICASNDHANNVTHWQPLPLPPQSTIG